MSTYTKNIICYSQWQIAIYKSQNKIYDNVYYIIYELYIDTIIHHNIDMLTKKINED